MTTDLSFDLAVDGIADRVPLPPPSAAVCVGVGGPVAVGKTRLAIALANALASDARGSRRVAIVSTDAFLLSNADLARRGLGGRKGFPDTYDVERLRDAVGRVRGGEAVATPVYSHDLYDVVEGEEQVVGPCDLVLVEGLHVLAQLRGLVDFGIYVDADQALLEEWYVERFDTLRHAARDVPTSFYASMAGMSDGEAHALAHRVWMSVNLPNCVENIAGTKDEADVVVVKGAGHCVTSVDVRAGRGGSE